MLITNAEQLKKFNSCHRVWQGIPGIEVTKGGREFISFYSGHVKETYGNYVVVIKKDKDGEFSEPIVAAKKDGDFRCFDPVLWIDPLGRLWLIWSVMPGEEVYGAICENPDAETLVWGEEFYIGRGIMMNKPTVLSSGEWLFPIAVWRLDIYHEVRKGAYLPDEKSAAFVVKTSDNGKTFVRLGGVAVFDRSCDEHMILEKKNGILDMFVRTGYGIGVSHSYDRGINWSKGEDSTLGGPNSRFFIGRLRSGNILLINHYKYSGRNNLTALLSKDDGKTFPYTLLLDERDAVSYPDAVEAPDGFVYVAYDRERGVAKSSLQESYACAREILTARFTEQDIIDGAVKSKGSYLKNVVHKLGDLCAEDPDPFKEDSIVANREMAGKLIKEGGDNIIEKVFEHHPVNCMNICDFDAKHLDKLIKRFKDNGSNDVDLLVKIIEFIRETPQKVKDSSPIIDKVRKYVREHLAEDFSVSDLADIMKVSVYYLFHLFKSETGTTIVEYRNEFRLMKAKCMLIETDETISDIAQKVGFCTSAYFAEVFSRAENISPTEYRKYHKQF